MKLYIVRHGETEFNVKHIIQGHVDSPLTNLGKKQAEQLGELLHVVFFDRVYCSSLERTKETARPIMKYQDCDIEYTKDLWERGYGVLEGKSYKAREIYFKEHASDYSGIKTNVPVEEGETAEDTSERAIKFTDNIYKKHREHTILFITHGAIKSMLLAHLEGKTVNERTTGLGNASLSIVEFKEDGKYNITLFNHTKHLNILV